MHRLERPVEDRFIEDWPERPFKQNVPRLGPVVFGVALAALVVAGGVLGASYSPDNQWPEWISWALIAACILACAATLIGLGMWLRSDRITLQADQSQVTVTRKGKSEHHQWSELANAVLAEADPPPADPSLSNPAAVLALKDRLDDGPIKALLSIAPAVKDTFDRQNDIRSAIRRFIDGGGILRVETNLGISMTKPGTRYVEFSREGFVETAEGTEVPGVLNRMSWVQVRSMRFDVEEGTLFIATAAHEIDVDEEIYGPATYFLLFFWVHILRA